MDDGSQLALHRFQRLAVEGRPRHAANPRPLAMLVHFPAAPSIVYFSVYSRLLHELESASYLAALVTRDLPERFFGLGSRT